MSFKKSIQISPTYAAYANLGNLYMDERRYAEAAAATQKALQLNGSDYRVWINLLLQQRLLKAVESARTTRDKALRDFIRQHPQDGTAQSWLAVIESEDKLRKESLQAIASALAISPKDPLVLVNVAEAFQNLEDRSKALLYAHESLKNGSGMGDLQTRPALESILTDPSFHESGKN
jgi:serine/threonine-protein kinase